MKHPWREGNRVLLLENGEAYFPRVFATIEQASSEVLVETFILFDDKVGRRLREVLIAAARRGVRVELTVDGWGSHRLTPDFVEGMTAAGVVFRMFDPCWKPLSLRYKLFRRMHRKLVVVDRRLAYVGGINFSADHLDDFGPEAKQDYAVELEGPVVEDVHRFIESTLVPAPRLRDWRPWRRRGRLAAPPVPQRPVGPAEVQFVWRDNGHDRNTIERHYRAALRTARSRVVIANAYFFPGFRLLRAIRAAARRGVDVRLILQGKPDEPMAMVWARMLYQFLADAGVHVHEYCRRPFHGKVAVIDDHWATVGSSNLDPLSLSLNLEANVIVRDAWFADTLRERLQYLMENECDEIGPDRLPPRSLWQSIRNLFVFHALRRFPSWAGLVPAHTQQVAIVPPPDAGGLANPELVAPGDDGDARPAAAAAAPSPAHGDRPTA